MFKNKKIKSFFIYFDNIGRQKSNEYFENSPIKGETKYFNGNNELDKTLLSKWIVYRNNDPKNQGLDKMVHPITPNLESITQLNVDGKIYKKR